MNNISPIKNKKIRPIHNNHFVLAEQYLDATYDLRYNSISLEFEAKHKEKEITYKILNENELFRELQKNDIKITLSNLITLLKSEFVPQYNPFEDYFINLCKWDGKGHINNLASYIKAKDQNPFVINFKKHLARIVACALEPDYFNKHALILVQNKQNTGKSTFCRFLCPPKLNRYIAEDLTTDKDSRILLAKNIIINLDELAVMPKRDINALKALFSKTQINERLPYDRKNSILPRRCSFVGSTNDTEFLTDETGSVRWLCFEISDIDHKYSKEIDINKVYSQAYYLYQQWREGKFQINLTKNELLENEERNKKHQVLSTERELIEKYFKPDNDRRQENFYTATEILGHLIENTSRMFQINKVQIGKALTTLKYPEGRDKLKRKGYFLKYREPHV